MRTAAIVLVFMSMGLVVNAAWSEESGTWEKFVNAPDQVWPTNGVCFYTHIGTRHIKSAEWKGGWVQIQRTADSTEADPVFQMKVSPDIAEKEAWEAMTLTYFGGRDSSGNVYPGCPDGNVARLAPAGAAERESTSEEDNFCLDNSSKTRNGDSAEIENLCGVVELTHEFQNGQVAKKKHEVRIYRWKRTKGADCESNYGPLEIVFRHDSGGSHNGIVH